MKRVKDLNTFERPREKLRERGPGALSDTELVAVILGSGNKDLDVMALAARVARVITDHKDRIDMDTLLAIDGIGPARAGQILAGFELARRHLLSGGLKITRPQDALPLLSGITAKQQEHFVCISLNGAHEVIEARTVTVGLLNRTQVHPREVFADVITDRAASVIFAHNHPSGDLTPSREDLTLQKQLEQAARILGITVLDHLIVSRKGYLSFQEKGYMSSP
jgi:DNA repair protein RadC